MRRPCAIVLAFLVACSSVPPTDSSNPPPPPPSGGAATIAVTSGDGQQALPALPVALNPAVIVKDAAGSPVSGAMVTFSVDSGGGTVTGGTVGTGSNGVATVGGWTLGPAEGRNVLKASVGALAPVRIVATATAAATATFPAMSIAAGGGSIAIAQPGPLKGFALALPGGAFAATTEWTVSYASTAGLPAIPGVSPITPLITISSTTGDYARSPMTLTLPVNVPAGMTPMVVMRDPASGTMEVLLTHRVNDTVVAATTAHLNAAKLMDTVAAGASTRRASLRNGFGIEVFVTVLSTDQLAADYDTHFRPGVNDWDFESMGTMQSPEGICAGISATAIWYWFTYRKSRGPLFGAYQRANGFPESSVTGIRWASLVQSRVDAQDFGPLNDFIFKVRSAGNGDLDMYNTLKANMMITGQPQLIALSVAGVENAQFSDHSAIAWKTVGTAVYIADASFPGDQTTKVTFNGSRFSSFVTPNHRGEAPVTYNEINTMGLSQEFNINLLADDWSAVEAKTINQDAFPVYSLHTKYGPARDTIWLEDTLRVWNECSSCSPVQTSPDFPEANGSLLALKPMSYLGSNRWSPQLASPDAFVLGLGFDSRPRPVSTTGLSTIVAVTQFAGHGELIDPDTDVLSPDYVWLDWHPFRLIKLGVSIAPTAPAQLVGTPLDLAASIYSGTPPDQITYQWDFGDATAKVSKDDDPGVTHTYATAGTFTAKVVLLDPATKQPMASATTVVTVAAPFIDFSVSGNWPNQTAPPFGTYHYTDIQGGRVTNASSGFDAILNDYDNYTTDHVSYNAGISLVLVIPTGSTVHVGQTFTKWVSGPPSIGLGQFQLVWASDLSHPEDGCRCAAGVSGNLTITAVNLLSDGTTAIAYSYSVTNGVGGFITGTGVGGYR